MPLNAKDSIDFVFYCAENDFEDLPDFALSFPDTGTKQGLKFWSELAADCRHIAAHHPELADYIAAKYDYIWLMWKERRNKL